MAFAISFLRSGPAGASLRTLKPATNALSPLSLLAARRTSWFALSAELVPTFVRL